MLLGEDISGLSDQGLHGAVNVIYCSGTGLSATAVPDQFWTQNSANVEDSAAQNERLGAAVATGDFDNDDRSDLAAGVPGELVGSAADAGGVNVIYGSSLGLRATAVATGDGKPDQFWNQDNANVQDVAEQSDNLGSSVA